ncbi:hypothetical protein EPUS_04543 [Endocarpon pusillum Z07020]|uniref:Uncharacterized protein n=1 Tax=Endocarpon pusillum (strain Z07020 / HMAS-L-300199) TaxID=1263415 RepID=U1GB12_ENDPU|nr:uncharacterized protein EPUS_04543 [Endocarpon pusillum Z07020]ERF68891.1 hypothetical protein EPUS_04543 [Endocarpon pusillum Z07020]
MSAEAEGARLLAGVGEEGLDEFLSELRHLLYPPKPKLGIPPLDRLLEVFCAPAQRLAAPRCSSPHHEDDVDRHGQDEDPATHSTFLNSQASRWMPVIIELTSSLPASGKTNLLYWITALAVLPSNHGGQGTAVVWFDNDGRFSAARLREVVVGTVPSPTANEGSIGGEDDRESLVLDALNHVHVFRPQSSRHLIETLDSLPSYLLDATAHQSMSRRLGLLVLDSASAFYWQDRYDSETARFQHPDQPRDKPSRTAEVITKLRDLQKEFDCAIAYSTSSAFTTMTKPALLSTSDPAAPQESWSASAWTRFANLTLNLSRVIVPRFPSHMSLKECLRNQEKRQDAVAMVKFLAEVDRHGSETWTAGVKEEWKKMEAASSFRFGFDTAVPVESVRM